MSAPQPFWHGRPTNAGEPNLQCMQRPAPLALEELLARTFRPAESMVV